MDCCLPTQIINESYVILILCINGRHITYWKTYLNIIEQENIKLHIKHNV